MKHQDLRQQSHQRDIRLLLDASGFWDNWEGLRVFFGYPKDFRKAIYTTNAIESLNSVIRTAVNKRKVFPSNQAALKVAYLATQQASERWSMPIRNWTSALNRFMIMFDERVSKHLI